MARVDNVAQPESGSSEGCSATASAYAVSSDLPATDIPDLAATSASGTAVMESGNINANDEIDGGHETMVIRSAREKSHAEEPRLVGTVAPDLASASTSVPFPLSAPAGASVPTKILASGSRPAGSAPALRGSGLASRASRVLRSRGMAIPCRGSRIAHRRHKLFGRVKRARCHEPRTAALREIRRYTTSTDSLMLERFFSRLVKEQFNNFPQQFRIQSSALVAIQEAAETFVVSLMEATQKAAIRARRVTVKGKDMRSVFDHMNSNKGEGEGEGEGFDAPK